MSNVQQVAGGVLGGVVGFFVGGPVGAVQGFALGFAVASAIFPPDFDEAATSEDPFSVTSASEGTPVPVMFGRRRVPGNIIWFDYENLEIEEVTPDGKGKGFGKGSDKEFGTFAYAPVAIGIAIGQMVQLHGIYNQKNEDWQQINSDNDGAPLQFSTPPTEIDFGYGPVEDTTGQPKSSPIKGITVAFSEKLFLGQNVRNMTPLTFDVEITTSPEASSFCGSPTDGMPDGTINPANIYYDILTNKQWALALDESWLDQTAFQEAHDLFEAEGFGLAPLWTSLTSGKKMLEDLNFHTRSIIRRATSGKLEVFAIRNRAADWTLPEKHCVQENVSGRSWKTLPNVFTSTFPDVSTDVPFTQRTINMKNEAAHDLSGRRTPKTYNFPHITDRDLALRRLELQKRHDSYPLVLKSVQVPQEYHYIRIGDVVSVTHSKFDFENFEMRVIEVKPPEFSGMSIRLRLLQEVPTLDGQVGPPIPEPDPPSIPNTEPCPTKGTMHTQEHWRSRPSGPPHTPPWFPPTTGEPPVPSTSRHEDDGGPIQGPDSEEGFFGYPLVAAHAEGCATDVGFGFSMREEIEANLPDNEVASSLVIGRGHLFTLDETLQAGNWKPALEGHGIKMTKCAYGPRDEFNLPDQDGVNSDGVMVLETSPYLMVIGNYEYCRWGRSLNLGNHKYEFQLVMRGQNKVRLLEWPAGTHVMVFKLRRPVIPEGLSDYTDWAHRPRFISIAEYNAGRRLRMYLQTISYAQRVQSVTEQYTQTFEKLDSGDPEAVSGVVQPLEILKANRGPTPACQGYIFGDPRAEARSWYPTNQSPVEGDMIVQMQPFANDWDGIGDRVVSDDQLTEPFGQEPYLPTDKANYDDYLLDEDGGRAYGLTYRLRIWSDRERWDLKDDPILTYTVSTSQGGEWPDFRVPLTTLTGVGGTMVGSPMMVDVLTPSGYYCIPQAISKIGVFNGEGLGLMGGGQQKPEDHYPDDTVEV